MLRAPLDPPLHGGRLLAAGLAGVALGGGLGVVGAFLMPYGPRLDHAGTPLSVGVAVAVLGNPLAALVAAGLTGRRGAAFLPLLGWFAAAAALSMLTTGGSVVLAGGPEFGTVSLAFLLLGSLAAAAGAFLVPLPLHPGTAAADSAGHGPGRG